MAFSWKMLADIKHTLHCATESKIASRTAPSHLSLNSVLRKSIALPSSCPQFILTRGISTRLSSSPSTTKMPSPLLQPDLVILVSADRSQSHIPVTKHARLCRTSTQGKILATPCPVKTGRRISQTSDQQHGSEFRFSSTHQNNCRKSAL